MSEGKYKKIEDFRLLLKITSNTDLTEGRGQPVLIGYTDNIYTAKRLASGKGVMGSNAQISDGGTAYKIGSEWFFPIGYVPPTVDEEFQVTSNIKKEDAINKAISLGISKEELKNMGVKL